MALELVNKTTATSVSSLDVENVFTADYDIYFVNVQTDMDAAGYFEIRLLQTDDTLANESKYDVMSFDLKSDAASSDYRFQDQNGGVGWRGIGGYLDDGDGYGFTGYIINPYASKYTFGLAQSASNNNAVLNGNKFIGVYKSTQSIRGMRVTNSSGTSMNYINVTTYGVKKD